MNINSVPVTLGLLQGPTKALVASVLSVGGAGLGATLLATSPTTALCLTYRQAYDDDVFQESPSNESIESRFNTRKRLGVLKNPNYLKLRPIGQDALLELCTPVNLSVTAGRNIALSSLFTFNKFIQELHDLETLAEETGIDPEYPPFPWKRLQTSVYSGCINACLDFTVQLVRSLLDWASAVRMPVDLSNRLRTVLRSAAKELSERPYWQRSAYVAHTAMYSEATLYLADWTVTCGLECYMAAMKARVDRQLGANVDSKYILTQLGKRCCLQGGRCTAVLLAVSLGNGVGSASPAKTLLCMFLCAQAASTLVNMYANAFIARVMGAKPPPEIPPPPAVGPPPPPPPPAPLERGPPPEPVGEAVEDALGDVFNMLGVNQGGPNIQPAGDPPAPAPPAAREVPRMRGGLAQLPARRRDPRRQGGIAGPGTPQAPREPRGAQPGGDEGEGARIPGPAAAAPPAAVAHVARLMADDPLPPETPPVNPGPSSSVQPE